MMSLADRKWLRGLRPNFSWIHFTSRIIYQTKESNIKEMIFFKSMHQHLGQEHLTPSWFVSCDLIFQRKINNSMLASIVTLVFWLWDCQVYESSIQENENDELIEFRGCLVINYLKIKIILKLFSVLWKARKVLF